MNTESSFTQLDVTDGNKLRDLALRKRSEANESPAGFTLVELIGTCLLLGLLFSMTIPMVLLVARQRQSSQQRQIVMQHAANLIETTINLPAAQLIPGDVKLPDPRAELKSILPALEQSVEIRKVNDDLPSLQIVAKVRWKNRTGEWNSPLELSSWIFPADPLDRKKAIHRPNSNGEGS